MINRNNLSQYPSVVFHPMLEEELGTGLHLELMGLSECLLVVGGGVGCYTACTGHVCRSGTAVVWWGEISAAWSQSRKMAS